MKNTENTIQGSRIFFLDNLRTFMIFLVVVLHSGLIYENNGFSSLIWIVFDPATNTLATELRMILDIFIMATIFFISGYLTPLSMKNKDAWTFVKTKFSRLIIPWIVAVLTLVPLYKFIFLYSRNLPQQDWTTYFHWTNQVWSQNWLWFLPVLFLFDILFLLFSKLNIKWPEPSLKQAIGVVFLIGLAYSICMDIFNLQGWTKTILLDFQNERLLIYFLMFLLGALSFRLKIFASKPKSLKLYMLVLGTVWLPYILYRYFYINFLMKPGANIFNEFTDTLLLWLSFHLSLLGLLYVLITTFRRYFDKQNKLSQVLNRNSYRVYIIHTVVMGALAMVLLNIGMPSILKFAVLTIITFVVCNLIIYCYSQSYKTIKNSTFQKKA